MKIESILENQSLGVAVEIKNVSKTYRLKSSAVSTIRQKLLSWNSTQKETLVALDSINLKILKGEVFGIIGRNGSGKTTLLNIIMGSIPPDRGGYVKSDGRLLRLSLGMGVDPNLSARDNIYVNGSVLGLTFKEIGERFYEILEFANLLEFVDTPVKKFSSGMRQRLMFSIAMHAQADVFLLDEFFGGTGDDDFRKKSNLAFKQKILNGNTVIMVSHNMNTIKKYCTRVLWIHKAEMKHMGSAKETVTAYKEFFKR